MQTQIVCGGSGLKLPIARDRRSLDSSTARHSASGAGRQGAVCSEVAIVSGTPRGESWGGLRMRHSNERQ